MWTPAPDQLLSIIGPTGSGKTAVAHQLATAWLEAGLPVSVISLDSRQVYQEFPRLSVAEPEVWAPLQTRYPDSLRVYNLGSLRLHEDWSFGVLLASAREQISLSYREKRRIILVGGTSVCHAKILETKDDDTAIPPDDNVRFAAENMTVAGLQAWLAKVDPTTAQKLNPSDRANPRRLVRKIEIALAKRLGITPTVAKLPAGLRQYWYCPPLEREKIKTRVDQRVQARFHDPECRQEVAQVLADWPDILAQPKLLGRTPLGFVPLAQMLTGKLDEQTALTTWRHAEWHYAKSQLTWCQKLIADHHTHLIDQREIGPDEPPVGL